MVPLIRHPAQIDLQSVAEKIGFDGGHSAMNQFEVKKRFMKRTNLKRVVRSGAAAALGKTTRKDLEEMNFLNWRIPFFQVRKTKSHLSLSLLSQEEEMFEENADSENNGE